METCPEGGEPSLDDRTVETMNETPPLSRPSLLSPASTAETAEGQGEPEKLPSLPPIHRGVLSDEPISTPAQDLLGFQPFARSIAGFIAHPNTDTPVTIGIYGPWGSGKTSLMRLVQYELRQQHIRTMWFNPWEQYRETSIAAPLLSAFRNTIRLQGGDRKPPASLPYAVTSALAAMGADLNRTALSPDSPQAQALIRANDYHVFREVLEELVLQIVGLTGRLVIFIDDLDRCLPDRVIEVLEDLKLVLNVPRCVFVLGADRELIQRGIQVIYKGFHMGDADLEGTEKDYLDKIVQLQFNLPPATRSQIAEYVTGLEAEPDLVDFVDIIADGLNNNPRRIKQFLNEYSLQRHLAAQSGLLNEDHPQLNNALLAKWLILGRAWTKEFTQISRYPGLLRRLERIATTTDERERQSLLESSPLLRQYQDKHDLLDFLALDPLFGDTELAPYLHLSQTLDASLSVGARTPDETGDELVELLVSEDEVVRETGVERLRAVSPRRRLLYARQVLERAQEQGPQSFLMVSAIRSLETCEDPQVVELLVKLLKQYEGEEVLGARLAAALGRKGKGDFADLLSGYDFVWVPPGEFLFGESSAPPEKRLRRIDGFYLKRHLITRSEYLNFVEATGHPPPQLPSEGNLADLGDTHPITGISWRDAVDYCEWLTWRLPTEEEWEKGARGVDGRTYPWGNQFDPSRCNTLESGLNAPTPVSRFPEGASPYGCLDMAGNVWEYTATVFQTEGADNIPRPRGVPVHHVLRGGSFHEDKRFARCAARMEDNPLYDLGPIGFRPAL